MMSACLSVFLGLLVVSSVGRCSENDVEEIEAIESREYVEEDWGDGLKVLTTYMPPLCEFRAKKNDIIHYHYVGRLASDGTEFGKSFDYNSPYIVVLGHGRIISGMDRGLVGTCLWERRRISFPPHLGYGSRGVGKTIPPNSSLVFYIRLIKIERNGHTLGEDANLSGIWNSGLTAYTDENWEVAIDMIEEAVRLYNQYERESLLCHKQCKHEDLDLSEKNRKIMDDYVKEDIINEALVHFSAKGKCLRECKSKSLPPQLRQPDILLLETFKKRLPYSYLHFSYYQTNMMELAARSCFTFQHYNHLDEQTLRNIQFYRSHLNLTVDEFIYRETAIEEKQKPFQKAKQAYGSQRWLEASDLFELSLVKFRESLEDCYLLCEDVVHVNLTQPDMSPIKNALLQEYGFQSDTMEYYEIQQLAVMEVLKCRDQCYYQASVSEGQHIPNYFSSHFDYLQYCYYKSGNIAKTAETAATFLEMEPSSNLMTNNIRFYSAEFKLTSDQFQARKEYSDIHEQHLIDQQLLQFAKQGIMQKHGVMGDAGVSSKDEL